MIAIAQSVVRPSVWIGCLSCYNAGCLTGAWVHAEAAAQVTPADLHGGITPHEELWVFDNEGLPSWLGECSPCEVVALGEAYVKVGAQRWGAYLAYVEDVHDSVTANAFEEAFQGRWETFADYLAEEIESLQDGWPEEAKRYFDHEAYERDARFDYTILDAPGGGVYVFGQ